MKNNKEINNTNQICYKLKNIRLERNLTISEISRRSGISNGFLSQVERGLAKPSMESLIRITKALGITMGSIFEDKKTVSIIDNDINNACVEIIRSDNRKKIILPQGDTIYHLLSPDLNRKIEFIIIEIMPGAKSGTKSYSHDGEEVGIVLSGKLKLNINDSSYILESGDSIYFSSTLSHSWENISDKEKVFAIWAITPPSL